MALGCGPAGVSGDEGVEEVQEPFGGARGEGVDRVGDDVGVDMLVEVEADGAAARACVLLIVVGNGWDSGEVGEAHGYRGGGALDVRCAGERDGFLRRCKRAREEDALCVCGSEAWMNAAVRFVECCDDVAAKV